MDLIPFSMEIPTEILLNETNRCLYGVAKDLKLPNASEYEGEVEEMHPM